MPVLAPGHHLYLGGDGVWRYSAPGDRFVRITGDHDALAGFQHVVHGVVPAAGQDAAVPDIDHLTTVFAERGLLQEEHRPDSTDGATIVIDGDTPLATAVAGLLADADQVTVTSNPVDEDAVRTADVVISCADWLPDNRWSRLDALCAEHGTAWHRAHAEDVRFFLGPMTVPGRTPSYRDLRGRRLAASGVAEELLTQWAYLEDPAQQPPPVCWPEAAGLAVLAGILAHDVRTFLRSGMPVTGNAQVEIDPHTWHIAHHPVLPLPVTADR